MSLAIDALLILQSTLVFLLAGYEYLTLMHFPALPEATHTSNRSLVSIILPVRDQAKTVGECVASLVGLEYPRKKLLWSMAILPMGPWTFSKGSMGKSGSSRSNLYLKAGWERIGPATRATSKPGVIFSYSQTATQFIHAIA